jgi:cell division protein ZapA
MSNVKLAIGGRQFTVACAEGEEDHVTGLGEMIAAKVGTMADSNGQNEARMLLFAALLLADELHEATVRSSPGETPAALAAFDHHSSERLDAIAERLENLAVRLEG